MLPLRQTLMLPSMCLIIALIPCVGCKPSTGTSNRFDMPSVAESKINEMHEHETPVAETVFMKIVEQRGVELDLPSLPTSLRTLAAVYHINGTLDTGGFNFLFDADGDPHYDLILQAYDTIGAEKAKLAILDAFSAFPNGLPPIDRTERMTIWNARKETNPSPDEMYKNSRSEVLMKLEEYVQTHPKDFAEYK